MEGRNYLFQLFYLFFLLSNCLFLTFSNILRLLQIFGQTNHHLIKFFVVLLQFSNALLRLGQSLWAFAHRSFVLFFLHFQFQYFPSHQSYITLVHRITMPWSNTPAPAFLTVPVVCPASNIEGRVMTVGAIFFILLKERPSPHLFMPQRNIVVIDILISMTGNLMILRLSFDRLHLTLQRF